jgi:predicted TIM-barrel fold metal-dependent hydrolase
MREPPRRARYHPRTMHRFAGPLLAGVLLAACQPSAPAELSAVVASPAASAPATDAAPPLDERASVRKTADDWRAAHKLVDVHFHVDVTPEAASTAVRVMDAAGIGVALNLSGGVTTHGKHEPSAFEVTKAFFDEQAPGRFIESMNLDYTDWDKPTFAAEAVAQVEEGARLGAAGFKEFKRLGLFLRDKKGALLRIDDPKLDPMWKALGRLGMPVSIHAADPKAFWGPYDATNERWKELADHPRWWFGDPKVYPPREALLAALERVVARHPETTFICVHFGNNAEDLDWVDAQLDAHPNMVVDLAARVPEIGRHDPARVRAFFLKHQDRILFGTDFQVGDGMMTLGSGGIGPPPTEADAVDFFRAHWRWFETADRNFAHMTPIQGDWTISAIALPEEVLAKVYFGNAERVFARALAGALGKLRSKG